jgi:hypothetical protein
VRASSGGRADQGCVGVTVIPSDEASTQAGGGAEEEGEARRGPWCAPNALLWIPLGGRRL